MRSMHCLFEEEEEGIYMADLVNCPHCGSSDVLTNEDVEYICEYGKLAMECKNCHRLYTVRDEFDDYKIVYYTTT